METVTENIILNTIQIKSVHTDHLAYTDLF